MDRWEHTFAEGPCTIAEAGEEVRQRPTRKQVRACVDDAERSYRKCWQTLASLRKAELDGCALFDFQPTLASALFKLDDAYRRLVHHRGALIQKKASHSAIRFRHRMRALDQDLKALRTAMRVGRNLGDAFAWTFYQYDQASLERHFNHPANPHTPPGVGGRGELEFIRQTRPQGFLMLYHGITSFLRIGDVSFFDVSTGRISAIGELKSVLVEPGKLIVRLQTISNKRDKIPFVVPNQAGTPPANREQIPAMNTQLKTTLERQMKKMTEVVRHSKPERNADLKNAYHIDELATFAKQLSSKQLAYQRIGKGGILVGCSPFRGRSLSSRIYSKASQASVVRQLSRIKAPLATICDPALPDNSILASELDPGVSLGIPPLFWLASDIDFLERVYFMRAIVATVYNPAHLFEALRNQGYDVRTEYPKTGPPRFQISKKVSKDIAEIEGVDFFLRLIQHRFMREAKIIESLEAVLGQMPGLVSGRAARLGISFVHFF
jgi:hypothetical protein